MAGARSPGIPHRYGKLREILLEVDGKALEVMTVLFDLLTPVDVQRPTRHLCAPDPPPVVDCPLSYASHTSVWMHAVPLSSDLP